MSNKDTKEQKTAQRARIPLRLLTRRYTSLHTTRLVASSKVLHNAIPTHNCDVIMTLPAKTDDVTLMWLLSRLRSRSPQIHVYVRHWKNTGMYAFYMTANFENLLRGAEMLGISKPLKAEYGGGKRDFVYEDQTCYLGIEDQSEFFTSEERQSIVYHLLLNLRAGPGESLGKIKFLEGQAIVPLLQSKGIISQVFPLHEKSSLGVLQRSWVQSFSIKQPLGKIQEYFGVKISMYFAYLGHYTWALTAPTFLGVVFWFMQSKNEILDDFCFMTFALFNVFWASLYTENWRRKSAELAYQWGTLDKKDELLQDPRPLYTGSLVVSPVTGRLEPHYAAWKRNLFRYFVTVPVIGSCLMVVFYWMLLIFELQEWVNGLVKNGEIPSFCQFLPKILLAVSIGILDEIYKKIATWLNDHENYRMEESYENHLVTKLVLFVNSFLSLFYIAFYLQDMDRLRDQLATLMITRQVIGNLREALLPWILWKIKLMQVGYSITGHMSPQTLEKEVKELGLSPAWSLLTEDIKTDTKKVSPDSEQEPETSVESSETGNLDSTADMTGSQTSLSAAKTTDKHEDETAGSQTDVSAERSRDIPQNDTSDSQTGVPTQRNTDWARNDTADSQTGMSAEGSTVWPQDDIGVGEKGSELTLTQAEVESTMKKYEDTFDDYLEMFIQYGYVILFSSAFPLAALCAFLNNLIEIHSDAFKLCVNHQRPFGKRVQNIGIWQVMLRVMGLVAVIVNCALIGVSGQVTRMHPGLDTTSHIMVILVLESTRESSYGWYVAGLLQFVCNANYFYSFQHLVLVLKMLIMYAIPSQPQWISQEMARLEFQRREALKSMEFHLTPPLDIHCSHSSKTGSKLASGQVASTLIPQVPARHHKSDLSRFSGSQESLVSNQDQESLFQSYIEIKSQSPDQFSQSEQSPDHSSQSDLSSHHISQLEMSHNKFSQSEQEIDSKSTSSGRSSKIPTCRSDSSRAFGSSLKNRFQPETIHSLETSAISRPNYVDSLESAEIHARVNNKPLTTKSVTFHEDTAQSIPTYHTVYDSGDSYSAVRSQGLTSREALQSSRLQAMHYMSDSEARMQTRQRILQSARLRQSKEAKYGEEK